MEVCVRGVVFEGSVGGIPEIGIYGGVEGSGLGCPDGGEVRCRWPNRREAPVMRVG